MARLLLACEGLIYSSERMLIFEHPVPNPNPHPHHGLALYKSLCPTNTVWKSLIIVLVYFILHGGCDVLSPLG